MPYLLRLPRELDVRLERLCRHTGLGKGELIERCLAHGMGDLEGQLGVEGPVPPVTDRPIDQLLRESGLGA
jgi:hypothetical protein